MIRKGTLLLAASSGAGYVSYLLADEKTQRKCKGTAESIFRVANLVRTVALISTDYYYHFNIKRESTSRDNLSKARQELFELQNKQAKLNMERLKLLREQKDKQILMNPAEKYSTILQTIQQNEMDLDEKANEITILLQTVQTQYSEIHRRNAIRLRDMCAMNRGVYIKLGQHIAMLDYILPHEYQEILQTLLANNPITSYTAIQRIFYEDIGSTIETCFDHFETVPIASASLAQVHVAYKNHIKYAVKIQHEGLQEHSQMDCFVITYLIDYLLPQIFPAFNYSFLTREMNLNLPLELNFQQEAKNLQQITSYLSDFIERGDVAIPHYYPEYSSSRVLTMSFEEGIYLHHLMSTTQNPQNTQNLGNWQEISKSQISRLISRIFAEQIFRYGFVHCGKK
jgi:predicted unusual protein kinase regulating ubiquinone biosynthesis (AarF/ABC1/UbiB family)